MVDIYTKVVLTIIAISLIGLLVKPLFNQQAQAGDDVININIASIAGERIIYNSYDKKFYVGSTFDSYGRILSW